MKRSILNLVAILFAKTNLRNMLVLIAAGMLISLNSCGSSGQNTETQASDIVAASEPKPEATIFENQELGWTIELSNDWSNEELLEEDNTPTEKAVLLLLKSENNMFIASAKNVGVDNDKAFEISHLKNIDALIVGYKKRGITFNVIENTLDTINGQHFIVYNCSLTDAKGTHLMNQKIYHTYINGFDLMTNLTYTNDIDKASLIKMMNTSKFKTINQ